MVHWKSIFLYLITHSTLEDCQLLATFRELTTWYIYLREH